MYNQADRRTVYELGFHAYPGLVVRVRKPSFGGLRKLAHAERVLGVGLDGAELAGADRLDAMAPAVEAFAEALVSWTLADGAPVPATLAGVESQDYEFVLDVVRTWYLRVVMRREQPKPVDNSHTEETNPPVGNEVSSDEQDLARLPVIDLPVAAKEMAG